MCLISLPYLSLFIFVVLQPVFCHFPPNICPLASTIVPFEITHNAFFPSQVCFLFPVVLTDQNILSIFKSSHIFQAVVTLYSQHVFFSWAMKAFSVLSVLPQRQLWARWPGSWGKTGSRVSIWQPPSSMSSSASPGTQATHLHTLAKTHYSVWWVLCTELKHCAMRRTYFLSWES